MVEVEQWSVFPRGPAGGNPCLVMTEALRLTAAQMLAIAACYGQESAFVTELGRSPAGTSVVGLRYFAPRHEMRMCVHATIAVVSALAASGAVGRGQVMVRTAAGEHRASWDDGRQVEVTVEQDAPSSGPPFAARGQVAAALGLPDECIAAGMIRPVSVSRRKLIVPMRDADAVHRARPDLPVLWALCREVDCTGAYIFAPHKDGRQDHLVARQFPVDVGYPEDPATGVAAAALAAYLADGQRPAQPTWARITVDQGDAMGQPSTLRAAALTGPEGTTRTCVSGQAARAGRHHVDLDAITSGRDLPEPELR